MKAVGIDIFKEKLDVFFSHAPRKRPETFPNTKQGIDAIIEKLPADAFVLLTPEEESDSEMLYKTLHDRGIACSRDNPDKVLKAALMLVKAAFKVNFQRGDSDGGI